MKGLDAAHYSSTAGMFPLTIAHGDSVSLTHHQEQRMGGLCDVSHTCFLKDTFRTGRNIYGVSFR